MYNFIKLFKFKINLKFWIFIFTIIIVTFIALFNNLHGNKIYPKLFVKKFISKLYLKIKYRHNVVNHNKLANFLKIYEAYDENGAIKLVRHGKEYDGGYIVPVKALNAADILLGYGIDKDNSFEDEFSIIYNKPSYGFDCGINHIDSKSHLFTFVNECIATDLTLYDKSVSSKKYPHLLSN